MRKAMLLVLILTFIINSTAIGEVSMRVCLANDKTPFLPLEVNLPIIRYPSIMVGTELSIIVSSDIDGYWYGGLFIREEDKEYGVLSARDYNDITLDWEGSRLDPVSSNARVYDWESEVMIGFDLYGHRKAIAGDWFIIDYTATGIGNCNVEFYDYCVPNGRDFPICEMVFCHVPTRDFNNDAVVDWRDFAQLASYWQTNDCNDPNWCEGSDLDLDGDVDISDLMLFAEYWLETTEYNFCPRDFDNDIKVNLVDFAILASYWQVTDCCNPDWCEGTDLDIDGDVDINDLMLFCDYWLKKTR